MLTHDPDPYSPGIFVAQTSWISAYSTVSQKHTALSGPVAVYRSRGIHSTCCLEVLLSNLSWFEQQLVSKSDEHMLLNTKNTNRNNLDVKVIMLMAIVLR